MAARRISELYDSTGEEEPWGRLAAGRNVDKLDRGEEWPENSTNQQTNSRSNSSRRGQQASVSNKSAKIKRSQSRRATGGSGGGLRHRSTARQNSKGSKAKVNVRSRRGGRSRTSGYRSRRGRRSSTGVARKSQSRGRNSRKRVSMAPSVDKESDQKSPSSDMNPPSSAVNSSNGRSDSQSSRRSTTTSARRDRRRPSAKAKRGRKPSSARRQRKNTDSKGSRGETNDESQSTDENGNNQKTQRSSRASRQPAVKRQSVRHDQRNPSLSEEGETSATSYDSDNRGLDDGSIVSDETIEEKEHTESSRSSRRIGRRRSPKKNQNRVSGRGRKAKKEETSEATNNANMHKKSKGGKHDKN